MVSVMNFALLCIYFHQFWENPHMQQQQKKQNNKSWLCNSQGLCTIACVCVYTWHVQCDRYSCMFHQSVTVKLRAQSDLMNHMQSYTTILKILSFTMSCLKAHFVNRFLWDRLTEQLL